MTKDKEIKLKPYYFPEPFRIKMVEPMRMLSKEERIQKIKEANYNLFHLKAEDVYIDLLTDSGTGAMSNRQWAGIMMGDEAYAGGDSYYHLLDVCKRIFGYTWFQPVHQGRAAEQVLLPILLQEGKVAIANMHFDTTRAHVELAGARAIDCVVKEALSVSTMADFKGNMDLEKLESLIKEYTPEKIGVIIMTITNNSAGGQPVSMRNLRDCYALAQEWKIPLLIDAARFAENAFFIKQREPEYQDVSIAAIVKEMFSYADGFTMSSKKDAIVNIGGLIGIKENTTLFQSVQARTIPYEGFVTYGGLAGRDLEALAIGLQEGMDESYLTYRIGQLQYMAAKLDEANIPYQKPVGGHALFIDAKAMFPHIPYYEFPAQALAVALYEEAGIRCCDIGSYMLGNDPMTKKQLESEFEFTRLAIPRRVYTQAHLDVVITALENIKEQSQQMKGYQITWEPEVLRHFSAHLKRL